MSPIDVDGIAAGWWRTTDRPVSSFVTLFTHTSHVQRSVLQMHEASHTWPASASGLRLGPDTGGGRCAVRAREAARLF
jgi:hypothetical protein